MPDLINAITNAMVDLRVNITKDRLDSIFDEFAVDLTLEEQDGLLETLTTLEKDKSLYFYIGFVAATRYWRTKVTTKEAGTTSA